MENIKVNLTKYLSKKRADSRAIFDLTKQDVRNNIWSTITQILKANEPNNKSWCFGENDKYSALIIAWFCKSKESFDKIAKIIGDDTLQFNKNLYVCGVKGSGKSSTVKALSDFIVHFTKETPISKTRRFKYVEQNKIANTFEVESNINKYTYNETKDQFDGCPINIILDDLKFDGLTKSFGTDFIDIIIRFLYDRYSIWLFGGANTIITSLLTPTELKKCIPDDLYNRFEHQYNIIQFQDTKRGVN